MVDEPQDDGDIDIALDDPPKLNVMVVECEVCREKLVNLLTRWAHEPGQEYDHEPRPVPRTTQPVIPPV